MKTAMHEAPVRVVIDGTQAFRRYRGWGRYCLELLLQFSNAKSPLAFDVFYHRQGTDDGWFRTALASPCMQLHPLDCSTSKFLEMEESRTHSWLDDRFPEADIYHSVTEYPFFTTRLRKIVTIHELTPLLMPRHHSIKTVTEFRAMVAESLRTADALVTVSQSTRRDLIKESASLCRTTNGLRAVRDDFIRCIWNGVGPQFHVDALQPVPAEPKVLYVGPVVDPIKNFPVLATALEAFPDCELTIVSGERLELSEIITLHPTLSRLKRVALLKNIDDAQLSELYRSHRALVFPSLHEGFGLPVAEAMASGCPVICGDHSSLAEIANSEELGKLCETFDVRSEAALRIKLAQCFSTTDSTLRERARRFAQENFCWRKAAESYERLYLELGRTRKANVGRLYSLGHDTLHAPR